MLTLMRRDKADTATSDQGESKGLWSSWWTRGALAVVVLIALLAVAVVVLRPAPEPEAAPEPAPATSAPAPADARGGSVCGLPPGDQSVPAVPPVSTDWELVGSVAAPTAPESIGPGVVDEGLRSCYSRSPLGALYAATNFLATTSEPRLRLPAARDLTAEGEGRDRALDLIDGADPGPATGGVQLAGFTFLNWDADSSVIDLAMRTGGSVGHLPVSMKWENGDWKVVLPPDGDLYALIAPLPNLTGYVPWAGS